MTTSPENIARIRKAKARLVVGADVKQAAEMLTERYETDLRRLADEKPAEPQAWTGSYGAFCMYRVDA